MSSTQTLVRPQEKQSTWSHIFPTETVTEQKSALFVKKLLAVAVSNITYLRAIFPEPAYGDRCLEDLNLKILKDESACPGACQVIKWVKGCFDALDKKFLRVLIIGIYTDPNDPETVIESYTFKFSYADDGGIDIYRNKEKISSAFSQAETKKATIQLLRTIVVLTQSLKSLPDDVMMTMKLLYYDDVTPTDYEPPGFRASDSDIFNFEEKPMNIKVGDVSTPFHTVKLRIKTDSRQFENVDEAETGEEAAKTQESAAGTSVCDTTAASSQLIECTPLPPQEEQEISISGLDLTEEEREEVLLSSSQQLVPSQSQQKKEKKNRKNKLSKLKRGSEEQLVPHTPASPAPTFPQRAPPQPAEDEADVPSDNTLIDPENAVETTGSQSSQVEMEQTDNGVRCCCGLNEDDGLMILCAGCRFWQHGVCFKIIEDDDAPERHICNLCGDEEMPDFAPTDPSLHNLQDLVLQATCLWRRALLACTESSKVLSPVMAKRLGVEMPVAQGLVNRLEKEGIIRAPSKGKKLWKLVDKEKLQQAIKKYFKKNSSSVKQDEQEDETMDVITSPAGSVGSIKKSSAKISDIDKLTLKAEALDMSGKKLAVKPSTQEKKSLPKNKARNKRVRAVRDQDEFEFDVEDSEDMSQLSQEPSKLKRRKKVSDVCVPMQV